MFSVVRAGFVAVMLSLLAGCAGKDFVRPSSDTFKLGQATYTQVVQQMGEPRNTGNVLMNEKNVKTATYVYASTGGEPVEEDVIPARALSYTSITTFSLDKSLSRRLSPTTPISTIQRYRPFSKEKQPAPRSFN